MKSILAFILICSSTILYAQEVKFGKVTSTEIEEKICTLDSSASASIIYSKKYIHYNYDQSLGFSILIDVHMRIKIYKQEGQDWATQVVSIYQGNGASERIRGINASTYNLVDGKIEEIKMKKDAIFEEEISKYRKNVKFTLPNVQPGSVIEFEYTINSPFSRSIDEIILQEDIPIQYEEVRLEIPEYFGFNVKTKGYLIVTPKNSSKRGKIDYTYKVDEGSWYVKDMKTRRKEIEFTTYVSEIIMKNVPALKEEPYVNNMNNYRSAIKYELEFEKWPDSPIEYFSKNWESVAKSIYDEFYNSELNRTGYFEKDINPLIDGKSDELLKVSILFSYLKNKVKWNGYIGVTPDAGCKKAYDVGTGNVAEINLLLTSMLRYAGLDANPVLVSTRANGIPIFPTREGFDYVICSINTGKGMALLDASSTFSEPNLLPPKLLNWYGMMIKKDGKYEQLDLYPKKLASRSYQMNLEITENLDLKGKCRISHLGHFALDFRENYLNINRQQYLEKLESNYEIQTISNYEIINERELGKPISETFELVIEDEIEKIGDRLYLSPLIFIGMEDNPFKLETREYPVDFNYPQEIKGSIVLQIPSDYKIESIPESISLGLPDGFGEFSYNLKAEANKIQVVTTLKLNQAVVPYNYYPSLKEFFSRVVEKETEKVVLAKKD